MAGVPHFTVDAATQGPDANLVADVYDVDASNNAILVTRNAYLLPGSGRVSFDLYGNDWIFAPGHRIGVLVTSSNADWWAHAPSGQQVTVRSAQVTLPFLSCARNQTIAGGPSVRLEDYVTHAGFAVDAGTVRAATVNGFPLPGPPAGCTAAERAGAPAARCADRRKFAFRVHQPRHGRIVRVDAFVNNRRRARVRGRRVTRFVLKKLPQGVFTVRVVATAANGQRTISVRKYRGCTKSRPRTHVHKKHRRRHG